MQNTMSHVETASASLCETSGNNLAWTLGFLTTYTQPCNLYPRVGKSSQSEAELGQQGGGGGQTLGF